MKVVGESHYQEALAALGPHCTPGDEGRPAFAVTLVAEPENPYDPNAIIVHGPTGQVGYLPRETAQEFALVFAELHSAGYEGATCGGLLNGGDRDRPNFGVVLTLSYPEDCERFLGLV